MKRLIVFVLLGVLTTVALSWTLAVRADWRAAPRFNRASGRGLLLYHAPEQGTTWVFRPLRRWGVMEISAGNSGAASPQEMPADRRAEDHEVPAWSTMKRGDDRGVSGARYLEQAFGWPSLAMSLRYRWTRDQPMQVSGLHLPGDLKKIGPGEWLPLRPVMPGFLINTALFAWLWFSVWAFPTVLIRAARRRRRACPGCGYDIRYTQTPRCPECGAAIASGLTTGVNQAAQ